LSLDNNGVGDFFNPLSAPQDIIDTIDELSE